MMATREEETVLFYKFPNAKTAKAAKIEIYAKLNTAHTIIEMSLAATARTDS